MFSGGGDEAEGSAPVKFRLPPAIEFNAAVGIDGFRAADFDQAGTVRAFGTEGAPGTVRMAPVTQQVTVNVQAMDARSFMDRSSEIAGAVREAMLHLNSINDVVNEL